MTEAFYEIYVSDDRGQRVAVLEKFISFDLALVTNGYGPCTVVLDGLLYDIDLFDKDYRLEFERNGAVLGNAPFLLVEKEVELSGGEYRTTLQGLNVNHLLDRPVIAYYAGSGPAASLTDQPCDNLLKRLVRYNIGSLAQNGPHVLSVADDLRDLAAPDISQYFTVAADTSEAATTNKAFSRRKLIDVMQEIAETSYYQGTPLFFGVEYDDDELLEFRTKIGQWGSDRRGDLVVSPEFGNLVNGKLSWNWQNEVTVAYALGDDENENRVVVAVQSPRATASIFSWFERTYDAANVSTTSSLESNAQALLNENRALIRLSGEVQETNSFQYGEDWSFGDRLDAAFSTWTGEIWVNRLRVSMNKKEELRGTVEVVND